jgi:hypothetical protein
MEKDVMIYLKHLNATSINTLINENFDKYSKQTRKNILKRILKYINGFDWWELDKVPDLAIELTLIWKLSLKVMKGYFELQEDGLLGEAQRELERLETDLEAEKINEQQYIERCNYVRNKKDTEECLMNVYVCSLLGKINPAIKEYDDGTRTKTLALRIMCLPCGWSGASAV